jgi:hypothetical protein
MGIFRMDSNSTSYTDSNEEKACRVIQSRNTDSFRALDVGVADNPHVLE